MKKQDQMLTTKMAGEILGFTANHIRRLCSKGIIKAEKLGHDWMLKKSSIEDIKRKRSPKEI